MSSEPNPTSDPWCGPDGVCEVVPTLVIDVYSDVVCPWCFVGMRRLDQVLADLKGVDVVVNHHPMLLMPNTPPQGEDLRELLRRRYGANPATMFAPVEAQARAAGIPLDFTKVARAYPTLAAHSLIRHAEARGVGRAVVDALFEAYFLRGGNIADADVLVAIATKHGFEADEARRVVTDPAEIDASRREAAATSAKGVRGVPLFVFDGKFALSGAQQPAVFKAAIDKALAPA